MESRTEFNRLEGPRSPEVSAESTRRTFDGQGRKAVRPSVHMGRDDITVGAARRGCTVSGVELCMAAAGQRVDTSVGVVHPAPSFDNRMPRSHQRQGDPEFRGSRFRSPTGRSLMQNETKKYVGITDKGSIYWAPPQGDLYNSPPLNLPTELRVRSNPPRTPAVGDAATDAWDGRHGSASPDRVPSTKQSARRRHNNKDEWLKNERDMCNKLLKDTLEVDICQSDIKKIIRLG